MQLSEAEWKIMNAVWTQHPASVRDVMQRLEDCPWAYTTVKTMLTRLAEKDVLAVNKRGNVSYFRPLVSRAEARRSAVRALLNRAFDGAFKPLIHFLIADEELSRRDLDALRQLLDEERRAEDEGQ